MQYSSLRRWLTLGMYELLRWKKLHWLASGQFAVSVSALIDLFLLYGLLCSCVIPDFLQFG